MGQTWLLKCSTRYTVTTLKLMYSASWNCVVSLVFQISCANYILFLLLSNSDRFMVLLKIQKRLVL